MKYNVRYRKLEEPSEADPDPRTIEGTKALIGRFYALNRTFVNHQVNRKTVFDLLL